MSEEFNTATQLHQLPWKKVDDVFFSFGLAIDSAVKKRVAWGCHDFVLEIC
jgi:hypothetical protein